MDVHEAIATRIDVREYADDPVEDEEIRQILDAARVASSGRNTQHWRFVLIRDADRLEELGTRSPSGGWVSGAAFAVAVLTDPQWDFHEIDAGKAIAHMQLAAWELGIGSGMFTTEAEAVSDLIEVPESHELTAVIAFGKPVRDIEGIKDRRRLDEIAYAGTYGSRLTLDE